MCRILNFVLSAGIVAAIGLSSPAQAQETVDPDLYRGAQSKELNQFTADDDVVINDGYVVPNFKNLAKLYWALAMFDLSDNAAIDNFLFITECDLYTKYFQSDFEFDSLRKATRETIVKQMASFPLKFEVMIPIGLDRYDTGTERFKLDPRSHFLSSKRLEVFINDVMRPVCGKSRVDVPGYPKNFILTLSRPFLLTEVPVVPELAQLYIEESLKQSTLKVYRYELSKFGRVAYVRLKITMNQFKGYSKRTGAAPMADIFGTIDSFELYADREKTLLLYKQPVREKKAYRRKAVTKSEEKAVESADDVPPVEQTEPAPVVEPAPVQNPDPQ